jgi:hypothetical protein
MPTVRGPLAHATDMISDCGLRTMGSGRLSAS